MPESAVEVPRGLLADVEQVVAVELDQMRDRLSKLFATNRYFTALIAGSRDACAYMQDLAHALLKRDRGHWTAFQSAPELSSDASWSTIAELCKSTTDCEYS